jgi:signal transduction histidine kinase/ligand-binding sensor domain-containing protein
MNVKEKAILVCLAVLGVVTERAGAADRGVAFDYLTADWETVDGLPENSATAIAQTPDGYLWMGTFNGLVRFNGTDFTVFNPHNTPALPSGGIVNLYADRRGRLWISTYEGLVLRESEEWRWWQADDGWSGGFVRTYAERANGDLLLTTFDGRLFEHVDGRFAELPSPPGEAGEGYWGAVDEEGRWWAIQSKFIGRWENGEWTAMIVPPALARDAVGCAPARDGGLWLLLGRELRKLRQGSEVARLLLPESPGGVWSMFEDSENNVWIASYNRGFCRVTPEGAMSRWNSANGGPDQGRCVFEDHEGNLWLGTSGDGLLRLTTRRFRHFGLVPDRRGVVVQSVATAPDGGVWAATYGQGLFQVSDAGTTQYPLPGLAGDIPYLQSVLGDRAGRLWVGTLGQGLRWVEQSSTRRVSADQIGGDNVIALFEDSRGQIWISGGGGGAARFDGRGFEILGHPAGVPEGVITGFAEDAAGARWLSKASGVFRQGPEGLFAEVRDTAGESIQRVTCLHADAGGSMWLGTADRGLLRWKQDQFARLDGTAGLPIETVQGLVDDELGYLWLTSGDRVVRAHRDELHSVADGGSGRINFQVFDANDGLPRAEFTGGRQPTCARDAQGQLWFATTKGVAMINPRTLRLNQEPPPVHVEAISYYQRATSAAKSRSDEPSSAETRSYVHGPFKGGLRLPPGSRRVEIKYAGLSYAAPEKARFQVKLEGWDPDWHDAGRQRVAYFHELPPRTYVFRVRAANNDGVWNETGASLAFTVLPYAWQTWWFRLGAAFLLVGLGGATVWLQSRTHVRRALEREHTAHEIRELAGRLIHAQEEERRRIARELHDDFSQRLALLSVEMELAGSGAGAVAAQPAPRLGEMANRVKELSSEVHRMAYELHPAKLDQLGLVAAARSYCRELEQKSGVRINLEADAVPRDIPADLSLCLYRIVQESLQNAVRHSGAAEARVELRVNSGRLVLIVTDSGRGFEVEQARREGGLGLSSMQERIRLVHGTLSVGSEPGRGARIEASVPLPRGNQQDNPKLREDRIP